MMVMSESRLLWPARQYFWLRLVAVCLLTLQIQLSYQVHAFTAAAFKSILEGKGVEGEVQPGVSLVLCTVPRTYMRPQTVHNTCNPHQDGLCLCVCWAGRVECQSGALLRT